MEAISSMTTINEPRKRQTRPAKYHFTPFMDEMIRKTYREKYNPRQGKIRELANRINMPRWVVTVRAREIGALEPRIKEPPWSERELHILEKNALFTPATIQRRLRMSGFKRTITAVTLKRKRLHLLRQQTKCTARAVAECFGVNESTVADSWIRKGLLKAQRRGTARTEKQGGDEYFIREKDIRKFIIENIGIIDIRKVDKFWFVDILAGSNHIADCTGD
ncbi:MAG TPA: hypothetical protein DDW17_09880 [Deltaproteobacteria bacterium]|nr:hypothetical protein [Deltaproteobacteria bacterium]